MAMERLENLSDAVTEGRSNVREEERVGRSGWIVNYRVLCPLFVNQEKRCILY